jgi:putative transposase
LKKAADFLAGEGKSRGRRTNGDPRAHAELRVRALVGRLSCVRVALWEVGLGSCLGGRKKHTTRRHDGRALPAPDLVRSECSAKVPNKLWTEDITYVRTGEGFIYLAFILDVHSRRVVSWPMASHLHIELRGRRPEESDLEKKALSRAIQRSDQGVHICCSLVGPAA